MSESSKTHRSPPIVVRREGKMLYSNSTADPMLTRVRKAESLPEEARSKQGAHLGIRPHPFNMDEVEKLRDYNEHHARCLDVKAMATVGLGHITEQRKAKRATEGVVLQQVLNATGQSEQSNNITVPSFDYTEVTTRVDELLNPLCGRFTWRETILKVAQDTEEIGNGYLEVVRRGRREGGAIIGLHHVPGKRQRAYVEDNNKNFHWINSGESNFFGNESRRFACFGERRDLYRRLSRGRAAGGKGLALSDGSIMRNVKSPDDISEIIHFPKPWKGSVWYGRPTWLAAVPSIELHQMVNQHYFDFFYNRGVPEFVMFFISEQPIDDDKWAEIQRAFQSGVGIGNSHKSILAQLEVNPDTFKIQIEKLSDPDSSEDRFGSTRTNIAEAIISAHGVPPLLAGIQIPGKLGAANEMVQAMQMFQTLSIGPMQAMFQQVLGKTLGDPQLGVPGLTLQDFEFATITDDIDVETMDTVARMRQSPQEAQTEGRDLSEGVKK